MNRDEVKHLLAVVMAYDNRKPGEANVAAWTEAANRGRWTFDEALDAIHAHYAERSEWLMPGMITAQIKAARQDRAMREPIVHPDPIGQARLLELTAGAFRAISGDDTDPRDAARRAALARPCPFCAAKAGKPCTRRGLTGPVTLTKVHPSRLEAA